MILTIKTKNMLLVVLLMIKKVLKSHQDSLMLRQRNLKRSYMIRKFQPMPILELFYSLIMQQQVNMTEQLLFRMIILLASCIQKMLVLIMELHWQLMVTLQQVNMEKKLQFLIITPMMLYVLIWKLKLTMKVKHTHLVVPLMIKLVLKNSLSLLMQRQKNLKINSMLRRIQLPMILRHL